MSTRIVELRKNILNKNDTLAHDLRARFQAAGVTVFNLVSSPGTGKTELLKRTMVRLRDQGLRPAALVGDLETDNDARRLAESGAPVRQIKTHTICHLEADMVARHLDGWDLAELDFLFIENVGNLVCPAAWDLGEHVRIVLLSATEGEDKPLKYPKLFHSADVVVFTKMDLAEPCEFDRLRAEQNVYAIRPGIPIWATSAKRGAGMDEFCRYLASFRPALPNCFTEPCEFDQL
jgi:hydrogenase nickel incorporation protein HypB